MKLQTLAIGLAAAFASMASAQAALAAADEVVIGDIDGLSGVYADVAGTGAIEAMKMAIADLGGTVLGRKIVTLVTGHQNQPDIRESKVREWADQNGLNKVVGGTNNGVSIGMGKGARGQKVSF